MAAPPKNREDSGWLWAPWELRSQAGSRLAAVLTNQCLVVGRWAHGWGRVGWWVLRRVGCCHRPWLWGDGLVALVRRPRVAGWHTWRLRVRSVHHSGGCGGGHDRCKENPNQDPQDCRPSLQHSQIRALGSSLVTVGSAQCVGWACLRRGWQHILYKQQQEQVKQTIMVTTKSTKMVRPMAIVAPNLSKSQS